jgi:hypothetical protein
MSPSSASFAGIPFIGIASGSGSRPKGGLTSAHYAIRKLQISYSERLTSRNKSPRKFARVYNSLNEIL